MVDSPKVAHGLDTKSSHHHSHHSRHRHSNGTKRPHSALHDSDDEDDANGHQEITHFGKEGAVHSEKLAEEKKPLVIPVGEDRRKRQKSGLPFQNTEAAEAAAAEAKAKAKPTTYGLNVKVKDEIDVVTQISSREETKQEVGQIKKTADEEALAALLGQKASSNTVIPTLTDEDTFHRDYDAAPDAPTEADYDAVPIEEFGAAMLRGMGWKDGEAIGRNKGQAPVQPRTLERRPELLGVGAKPAKALGIELGEWGKHAKKHERKIDQAYAPVMLKNKKTGEMITEEEMQKRLKEQEMGYVDDDPEEDSDRRGTDKERRRERERDRSRDRQYDDRKYKSSRRGRSASYEKRSRRRVDDETDPDRREGRTEKDRKRRDDDESDRERRQRRREKDRKRRDRSDSRDRYRSSKDGDRTYRKDKSYRDKSDRDRR